MSASGSPHKTKRRAVGLICFIPFLDMHLVLRMITHIPTYLDVHLCISPMTRQTAASSSAI
jgi:hypothetical protein